ncbi:MAG TPA: phosphoglycerate kinase [Candidatus Paceibacterota bacterium]|nr:phosphoglycerate kinase [Candidatus Paceibacterota bacterium]
MQTVRDIRNLANVPVLVRAALNVPLKDGKVANSFRLKRALKTIEYLRTQRARVILVGHIGDKGTETLLPVYEALKVHVPRLKFCPVAIGKEARAMVRELHAGEVLMLENVRRYRGEKLNDPSFAADLAELADIFVEDSFDVCHRAHASVVGVAELLPSYAGFLVEAEVRELEKALRPKRPSLAIIGGAKFTTKQPVIKKLLERYDRVFVGGALANDFLKAKGMPVEDSLVSKEGQKEIAKLLKHKRLLLPSDEIIGPRKGSSSEGRAEMLDGKAPYEAILDSGPRTRAHLRSLVQNAKTILWNGPLGNYEQGYTETTEDLARAIAESEAYSIIGGGDTIAALEKLGIGGHISFISTGGGAMLDFLAKGTLPGLSVLGYRPKRSRIF